MTTFSLETFGTIMAPVTIAERIQEAMKVRDLNQNQLRERCGFPSGYLSNLFKRNSNNLTPATLEKFAAGLGVRYEWLAKGEGEMIDVAGAHTRNTPHPLRAAPQHQRPAARRGSDRVVLRDAPEPPRPAQVHDAAEPRRDAVLDGLLDEAAPRGAAQDRAGGPRSGQRVGRAGPGDDPGGDPRDLGREERAPSGAESGAREHQSALEFTKELLRKVRETGRWEPWEFGLIGYPWRLGRVFGVAITVDMRRSLSRAVYGYEAAE